MSVGNQVGKQMSVGAPKVSVCIVCYNQAKYIKQTLCSVLSQEVSFPVEVLVLDDHSTDNTPLVIDAIAAENPGVVRRLSTEKNLGAYRAFQRLHEAARGQYVAHLDGDDYFLPGKLTQQVARLDAEPECNVVWHRVRIRDESTGRDVPDFNVHTRISNVRFWRRDMLLIGSIGCHSARMYRAGIWNGHDWNKDRLDFYYDVKTVGQGYGVMLDDFLGVYRKGVGIAGSRRTDDLILSHQYEFFAAYPDCRSEIAANALLRGLVRLRHGRGGYAEFALALRGMAPRTLGCFLRLTRLVRNFRSRA